MSTHKSSLQQFTRFFNRFHGMPRGDFKLTGEVEVAPAISSNKSNGTSAGPLPPQDLRPATIKGLERYYAKPGEAEWGC